MNPRILRFENLGSRGYRVTVFADQPAQLLADGFDQIRLFERDPDPGENGEDEPVEITAARIALSADSDIYSVVCDITPGYFYSAQYGSSVDAELTSPVSSEVEGSKRYYLSLAEAKAMAPTASDAVLLAAIKIYQDYFEQTTGWWFEPRRVDMVIDGEGRQEIEIPFPIISISAIYLNGQSVATATSDYTYCTDRRMPAWRAAPRISLGSNGWLTDPYAAESYLRFAPGQYNQRIVGTFGMVDEDGDTPAIIKEALLRCIRLHCSSGSTSGSGTVSSGILTKLVVKDHEQTFQPATAAPIVRTPMPLVVRDSWVEGVLRQYRRPAISSSFRFSAVSL